MICGYDCPMWREQHSWTTAEECRQMRWIKKHNPEGEVEWDDLWIFFP